AAEADEVLDTSSGERTVGFDALSEDGADRAGGSEEVRAGGVVAAAAEQLALPLLEHGAAVEARPHQLLRLAGPNRVAAGGLWWRCLVAIGHGPILPLGEGRAQPCPSGSVRASTSSVPAGGQASGTECSAGRDGAGLDDQGAGDAVVDRPAAVGEDHQRVDDAEDLGEIQEVLGPGPDPRAARAHCRAIGV